VGKYKIMKNDFKFHRMNNEWYHKDYPEIRISDDEYNDPNLSEYELNNFVRKKIEEIKEKKSREAHVKKTGDIDLKKLSDSEVDNLIAPLTNFRQHWNSNNPS
jgi:hypothetical protein